MKKNPHAVALGRLGGAASTKSKARAARANGKLGGYPKGKKRDAATCRENARIGWLKRKAAAAAKLAA